MDYPLVASVVLSGAAAWLSHHLINEFIPVFIQRRMYGVDQCKKTGAQVPEPMGVITSAVYLIVISIFLPLPFYGYFHDGNPKVFPYHNFVEFLSAQSSICCMVFLGFADDVLDLRWRHKLMFPTLASIPLLVVYWANFNSTYIIVPQQLVWLLGDSLNIGCLYYVYMGMMAVFCTNAINILAGINGLEAGQSFVIAVSVAVFNVIQLIRWFGVTSHTENHLPKSLETQDWYHQLSLYFLLPYIATTGVLLKYNWYPARVFVGDTFCYFSGMTLAVVGILGHFSKTMMLLFIPQIVNFLYSCPQLFRLVPCPRHRLPKYDAKHDVMRMSTCEFVLSELSLPGRLIVTIASAIGLLHREDELDKSAGKTVTRVNNMTLINLCLKLFGPMHERSLTILLLVIQVLNTVLAFFIRFVLAGFVYEHVD